MTREQYVQMRRSRQMNLTILYQYYTKKLDKGQAVDFATFSQLFPMYLQGNSNKILKKLDAEFGVTVLTDQKGNEIQIS